MANQIVRDAGDYRLIGTEEVTGEAPRQNFSIAGTIQHASGRNFTHETAWKALTAFGFHQIAGDSTGFYQRVQSHIDAVEPNVLRVQVQSGYDSTFCERCGAAVTDPVWLTLDWRTNTFTDEDIPDAFSQGAFAFGKDCAKQALAEHKRKRTVWDERDHPRREAGSE